MDAHPMNTLRSPMTIAALVLLTGLANADPTPEGHAPGSSQQVEDALEILPRVGTEQTPVMPTRPKVSVAVQPGLTKGEDWLKDLHETLTEPTEPSTLAEGAFVLNRLGTLVPANDGLFIFVPDKAAREPGEGPVLLMPCRTLEQLETEWTGQPVEISGEIFTYHNRNQLLISAYRLVTLTDTPANPPADPIPQSDAQAEPSEPNEPSSIEDDPDVRDLLKELGSMDEPTDQSRTSARDSLVASPTQTARRSQVALTTTVGGLDEGTLILRRPARMIRRSSGAWTIVFDHDDPDSTDATELIVEPCRMLMRMETIAMEAGDAGQLLISGRVYTHRGDHYILPTLMQRVRPQELGPLQ